MHNLLALSLAAGIVTMAAHAVSTRQGSQTPQPNSQDQAIRNGLQPFAGMIGDWEGTLGGPTSAAGEAPAETLAIVWRNAWSFDGRWLRMEFASREPGPRGNHLEFLGLMTFNPADNRIESIWMNPRIRLRNDRFIDGREMFFEKGSWDAAGKVLTLIAPKQNGVDAPTIEVRSTFTLVDADHFTCVDEEKDPASGTWKAVTRFELTRRR